MKLNILRDSFLGLFKNCNSHGRAHLYIKGLFSSAYAKFYSYSKVRLPTLLSYRIKAQNSLHFINRIQTSISQCSLFRNVELVSLMNAGALLEDGCRVVCPRIWLFGLLLLETHHFSSCANLHLGLLILYTRCKCTPKQTIE